MEWKKYFVSSTFAITITDVILAYSFMFLILQLHFQKILMSVSMIWIKKNVFLLTITQMSYLFQNILEKKIETAVFPYCRLFCDVECLINDPLEKEGLGISYSRWVDEDSHSKNYVHSVR